jgi:uncharacterized membrane protein YidH (DUF202 family)
MASGVARLSETWFMLIALFFLERTFLAWLRTSLAFASIGIAVTQLFRLNSSISSRAISGPSTETLSLSSHLAPALYDPAIIDKAVNSGNRLRNVGKPLGATFIGIAIVILFVGSRRYFESQYWIIRGKFPASRGSVALVTLATACLIMTSIIVVLIIAPSAIEA